MLFRANLSLATAAALFVLGSYALRLGLFLAIREARGGAYKQVLEEATAGAKKIPLFLSVLVWITVGLLFFAQVSPLYFRLENGLAEKDQMLLWAGVFISLCGLLLQTSADAAKSAAKKRYPGLFCSSGLFRIVRCPNYLGEIIVWTGVLTGSLSCLSGPAQWLISVAGYLAIIFIMFNGARRLEKRQSESYGSDPEFQAYCRTVPILIPLVPLYSLKKYAFLG